MRRTMRRSATGNNFAILQDQTIAISTKVSVIDADRDAITHYQF